MSSMQLPLGVVEERYTKYPDNYDTLLVFLSAIDHSIEEIQYHQAMQILVEIFIPLLIILMMLVVGLELTLDDFQRVRQFPKIVIAGSTGQLLLLATLFNLSEQLHVGLLGGSMASS